jgi:hypothetical protein
MYEYSTGFGPLTQGVLVEKDFGQAGVTDFNFCAQRSVINGSK